MRYTALSIILIIITHCGFAQTTNEKPGNFLPTHLIQVTGGYSVHGSGDMKGIIFGSEFRRYYSRKFSLNYNIRGTINSGRQPIMVHDYNTQNETDASIRFTTAGVQLGVDGGYSLVRTSRHEFMLALGAFGRYQSASNGDDGYALYMPQTTGVPTVLVGYDNHTPQHTVALGGVFQLHYNYTFNNKLAVGLTGAFQTDTHGDALPYAAITIGRRL